MLKSLDIDSEMGDVEFIEDLERTFGVTLGQRHIGTWDTLGDVHRTLMDLVPKGSIEGRCPTAMVFYRLRNSLQAMTGRRYGLDDSINDFIAGAPKDHLRRIAKDAQLKLPSPPPSWVGCVGIVSYGIGVLCLFVALAQPPFVLVAAGFFVCGYVLRSSDPGRPLPNDLSTLGALAKETALMNFTALRARGARRMPDEEWDMLTRVAIRHAQPAVPIDPASLRPETYLLQREY